MVTVFFAYARTAALSLRRSQIGQSIPIVAENEEIADRLNSRLKLRAQISDESARRFLVVRRNNLCR
jgi:hypothetical protein